MSFTTLRVTSDGVVGYRHHLRRIERAGSHAAEAFARFAREADPGIYAIIAEVDGLDLRRRERSLLRDELPIEYVVSPFAGRVGAHPKLGQGSPYDALRRSDAAVVLTDAPGEELYESSLSAVVGWDGERFVLPPLDRPRVESVAEAILDESGLAIRRPLMRVERSIALVNAVGVWLPRGSSFPRGVAEEVEAMWRSAASRP